MGFLDSLTGLFSGNHRATDPEFPVGTSNAYDVWACPTRCKPGLGVDTIMAIMIAGQMPDKDPKKPRPDGIVDPRGYYLVPKGVALKVDCPVCRKKLARLRRPRESRRAEQPGSRPSGWDDFQEKFERSRKEAEARIRRAQKRD